MSRPGPRLVALVPAGLLLVAAVTSPAWADPAPPAAAVAELPARAESDAVGAPAPVPVVEAAPLPVPSMKSAVLRLLGATVAVALLLAASLVLYRRLVQPSRAGGADKRSRARGRARPGWLSRWVPEPRSEADRIRLLHRTWVGARESIGVVLVGRDRFLVGITGASISLLARLDDEDDGGRALGEPEVREFATELGRAGAPADGLAESAIRSSVARSRDRLSRLARVTPIAPGPRG